MSPDHDMSEAYFVVFLYFSFWKKHFDSVFKNARHVLVTVVLHVLLLRTIYKALENIPDSKICHN